MKVLYRIEFKSEIPFCSFIFHLGQLGHAKKLEGGR